MTISILEPLLWILLVLLLVAIAVVIRARSVNKELRGKCSNLESARDAVQGERDRLHAEYRALTDLQANNLAAMRTEAEEDTKAVLKSAMRTLQVLADEQQLIIEKAQKTYGEDEQILADLMTIDHTNGQFGRRAQGIAVLCGGWLGRRETTASVYDVARSAQGRIKHFDRVNINTQVNVSVASKAVEPVAVVLAELLANATNYSAPGTRVDINIQAVPTGICLIVDDAGLGMSQEEKVRAGALLSPEGPVAITGLGDPPKFGFAVCGMLATRYGFKVSVDSVSPYGGVRAVILLPKDLLTTDVPTPSPAVEVGELPAENTAFRQRRASVAASAPAAPAAPVGTTTGGLPKRRRRVGPVEVAATPEAVEPEPEPEHNSEVMASRIGAFQRGTLLGRDMTTTEGPQEQ